MDETIRGLERSGDLVRFGAARARVLGIEVIGIGLYCWRGVEMVFDGKAFVGRYPIMRYQYRKMLMSTKPSEMNDSWQNRFGINRKPVIVSHDEAEAYCAWLGARLPEEEEWRRFALKPWIVLRDINDRDPPEARQYSEKVLITSHSPYPWGDAQPDASKAVCGRPTTMPCLEEVHLCTAHGMLGAITMQPARPGSASWCGVLDLWHVRERIWTNIRIGKPLRIQSIIGGSFNMSWRVEASYGTGGDIGFRVILG